jgi:hypothetical protein
LDLIDAHRYERIIRFTSMAWAASSLDSVLSQVKGSLGLEEATGVTVTWAMDSGGSKVMAEEDEGDDEDEDEEEE